MSDLKHTIEDEIKQWEEKINSGRYKGLARNYVRSKIKVLNDVLKKHKQANEDKQPQEADISQRVSVSSVPLSEEDIKSAYLRFEKRDSHLPDLCSWSFTNGVYYAENVHLHSDER